MFPADISEDLLRYESSLFWFQSRSRLVTFALNRFFPAVESFLEVGCGTGSVVTALARTRPEMRVVGTDIQDPSVRLARNRLPGLELLRSDAGHLPFKYQFDVVGSFDLLEHTENDVQVLRELYRVVRPGGGIIITVPQHAWLWSATDSFAHHLRRYSRSTLVTRMNAAGFRPIYVTSFVSLLFPLMCLSRMKLKMMSRKHVRERFLGELELSAKLNRLLERISLVEEEMIRRGMHFPVGGSLLAVGMKG